VWARLRHNGVRTSLRRVLRLMKATSLLAPSRGRRTAGPRTHDGTIIPETVDTMWGTDLTTTTTGEGQVAVFVAVDPDTVGEFGLPSSTGVIHEPASGTDRRDPRWDRPCRPVRLPQRHPGGGAARRVR